MNRCSLAIAAVFALLLPTAASAQNWNDARTLELVHRATERRATQLADTALKDYRARARGYLTFLAQVGAGFPEPPKIIKADELALDVYWAAPDRSKQLIVGTRDTLLLPTDIRYHRDHLGIIQNNFPEIIRLGDGDEVGDVPHPISGPGIPLYDFAITDSLRLRMGPREIDVIEVRVRPKQDRAPRVVGAVYIERESADLVRMALGFTRAAMKDEALEDLHVVLENGLIDGRFWLPRRQEIEIRRTGTWLEYPVRTIIRGRWEICCFAVNVGLPAAVFTGPEIAPAPRQIQLEGDPPLFEGDLLDAVRTEADPVSDAEVRRVQAEVRELVRAQALARARRPVVVGTSLSDFLRYNRVEGLALGAGVGQPLGAGFFAAARGRYGFGDERLKGVFDLSYRRADGLSLRGLWRDTYGEAEDVAEVSLVRNTFAAQEFGSDYTQPYGVRGSALELSIPLRTLGRVTLEAAVERNYALGVNVSPARGSFAPTLPVPAGDVRIGTVRYERPTARIGENTQLRFRATASAIRSEPDDAPLITYGRITTALSAEHLFGGRSAVVDLFAAGVGGGGSALPQHHVLLGGPVSGPGYGFHELAGRRGGYAHFELRTPVPFPRVPLSRYGRTPGVATLAPYFHAAVISAPPAGDPAPGVRSGAYPSVGVALLPFFELLRFDFARGLRDGRWFFGIDITRDFWPVL
jgi:hypothetical protein